MANQTQRLELATVNAELGSHILFRFANDAVGAALIPTDSGDIKNLKQVVVDIQADGAEKISFATTIYPTTAAGIAATTDGAIFLVKSSDPDEIYAVYSNTAGLAVDTGKRALSATAIQAAMDASAASASAAAVSAATAATRVAPFLGTFASAPTLRGDGSALQIGDRYFNSGDDTEYLYRSAGWEPSNVDWDDLATATGLVSVSAMRALSTIFFTRAETLGYTSAGDGGHGKYYFILDATPPTDNGLTVIHSDDGRGYWMLIHSGTIDVKQAGARAGIDCATAFSKVAAAVVASNGAISRVVFSAVSGGQYTVGSQVLFNCSQVTYEFHADVVNTSTAYTTPLVFAHDINAQPLAALFNVTIIGNGHKWDGNGAAILAVMGLGAGVLPSTFPAPMFNYIDNLKIHEVDFANGVYDSLNLRQCRNHKISKCIFRDATQYLANGLNITTNWATYIRGDYRTYSHGVVEDCVAYNNSSMGMTYYHCSGGTCRGCIANNNGLNNGSGGSGSGFSYESPSGSVSIKYADGRFENCHANNNGINGYYINTPGVTVDADCTSMGNGVLGLTNDVSGLQMCGVVVSGANQVTVLGIHTFNARHGASFLGATGLLPTWNCGGEYSDNAGCGIAIQSIHRGGISPGTKLFRNGRTLVGGQNLAALSVSNSAYNNMGGSFTAVGLEFDSNGARDINVANVRTVEVGNCKSYNTNDVRGTTGGTGYNFGAITTLLLHDNFLDVSGNGWTTNGYIINNDVSVCYQKSNKSNQATGTVMTNNASTKFGISNAARMTTGTHTTLTTLPATGSVTLVQLADFVATLAEAQKDGLMQA